MKKLLQLFGFLDLIAIIGIFNWVLFKMENFPLLWMKIAMVILGLSLIVSGYLLIKNKIWGVLLNYVQFIPRLTLYAGMSFGFIYLFSDLLNIQLKSYNSLFVFLVVIDFIRLGLTIYIHYKYLRINKASLQHMV